MNTTRATVKEGTAMAKLVALAAPALTSRGRAAWSQSSRSAAAVSALWRLPWGIRAQKRSEKRLRASSAAWAEASIFSQLSARETSSAPML